MMNLEEVEREIAGIYVWFSENAPGVQVQEIGHLSDLWAVADSYYERGE